MVKKVLLNQINNEDNIHPQAKDNICRRAVSKVLAFDSSALIFETILRSIDFFGSRLPQMPCLSPNEFKVTFVSTVSLHHVNEGYDFVHLSSEPVIKRIYSIPCTWVPDAGIRELPSFLAFKISQTPFVFESFPIKVTKTFSDTLISSDLDQLADSAMIQVKNEITAPAGRFRIVDFTGQVNTFIDSDLSSDFKVKALSINIAQSHYVAATPSSIVNSWY